MNTLEMLQRIESRPEVCHAKPCFKGTRIMIHLVLELIEAGIGTEQIIKEYYPQLKLEDIQAALHYAVALIKDEEFIPLEKVA